MNNHKKILRNLKGAKVNRQDRLVPRARALYRQTSNNDIFHVYLCIIIQQVQVLIHKILPRP